MRSFSRKEYWSTGIQHTSSYMNGTFCRKCQKIASSAHMLRFLPLLSSLSTFPVAGFFILQSPTLHAKVWRILFHSSCFHWSSKKHSQGRTFKPAAYYFIFTILLLLGIRYHSPFCLELFLSWVIEGRIMFYCHLIPLFNERAVSFILGPFAGCSSDSFFLSSPL